MKCIESFLRDGKPFARDEWNKLLSEDIEVEDNKHEWNVCYVIRSDINNGREVSVNGHSYYVRLDYLYDTAEELFDALIDDGRYNIILDAIKSVKEKDLIPIIDKMECVETKDGKYLLTDENCW